MRWRQVTHHSDMHHFLLYDRFPIVLGFEEPENRKREPNRQVLTNICLHLPQSTSTSCTWCISIGATARFILQCQNSTTLQCVYTGAVYLLLPTHYLPALRRERAHLEDLNIRFSEVLVGDKDWEHSRLLKETCTGTLCW